MPTDRTEEIARELKQALADNAYPAADGTADIDNHAIPLIAITLKSYADECVATALRAFSEAGWRFDMENAPRDGTRVVLWVPDLDPPTIQAEWSILGGHHLYPEAGRWVDVWNNDPIENATGPVEPKGWLILPAPPEGA